MVKLEINLWSEHLNQLIYSYFYYCEKNNLKFNVICNKTVVKYGAVLYFKNKRIFFDYSDDFVFLDEATNYDFYFKRSLTAIDYKNNIFPLGFNVPMSYKSIALLSKLPYKLLTDKNSIKEIIEAADIFEYFNGSHKTMNIKNYPEKVLDNGGRVIFQTRLWDPDNHIDKDEKDRRHLQNEFRINACRIILKHFKTASVGLAAGALAQKIAPDLIISNKQSSKKKYLKNLSNFDIGIADDGLKNAPGWKIGEYLLYGKAVVTTPLNIIINDFHKNVNFVELSGRNSFIEIPDKISMLQKDKKYLEIGTNNLIWSRDNIHPVNYINQILSKINLI